MSQGSAYRNGNMNELGMALRIEIPKMVKQKKKKKNGDILFCC